MEETKKTIGQIATELKEKENTPISPIDIEREANKDYIKNLHDAVDRGKKDFEGDFFVVVLTKKERLLERVLRNYFFVRKSCPTPDYDQAVYYYHAKDEMLEFIWVLPSKDTCKLFLENIHSIAPEEHHLLEFVIKDRNGELLALSKKLNNEVKESNKLEGH